MTDEQDTTDSHPSGSPFTRPAFLLSAVLVAVIVVLGGLVAVRAVSGGATAAAPPSASFAPGSSTASSSTTPSASICGLPGSVDSGTLTAPPAAAWQYEDTTAYPTSPEFGPAKTADQSYRYCFQHTPTGAVFATANALAQGTSSNVSKIGSWADYFVSQGAGRAKLLDQLNEPRSDGTGVRMTIVGFKVLSYGSDVTRIDIAVQTSSSAQTVYASAVYELLWQAGDWKLNSDAPTPFNFSTVSDVDGYVPWKA